MNELIRTYSELDKNDKRNKLSDELLLIGEIIRQHMIISGIDNPNINIKNYDLINDKDLTEDEMLTFIYEDIYNIEKNLLTLLQLK